MSLELRDVSWGVPGRAIVKDVTATIHDGEVVGLVGPNGCGKSSLLRCLVGLRRPTSGTVTVDGIDVHACPPRERARKIAFVEQVVEMTDDMTVADVVGLGRTPYASRWQGHRTADRLVVASALEEMGLSHLAGHSWRTISGGERQRTQLARAIAQQTPYLVLDEPTNHLDVRHQLQLMEHLRACRATVVVCLHDLGLAGRYCDRLLLLREGLLHAEGPAEHVLTTETIRGSFDVQAQVEPRPGTWSVSYSPTQADAPSSPTTCENACDATTPPAQRFPCQHEQAS